MAEIRAEMVEAARKFMLTPKVKETPFEEQRQFLIGKGVTDAEISEARASIPAEQLASQVGHVAQPMMGHVQQQSRWENENFAKF